MRIVFFGTPEIAAYQLEYLNKANFNIVGVVTTPDRPQGRGKKFKACAVKSCALDNDIPVLEPQNLKAETFISDLKALNADIQVVVAFRMLPEVVWGMPKMGTLNLHASLLPQYRGAAPINHVIINGETKTGVSTFLLQHEIDTGNILLQQPIQIEAEETAGSLHDKIMHAGGPLLEMTLNGLQRNKLNPIPQTDLLKEGAEIKHAPKIFKEDCLLSLNSEGKQMEQKIRGLSPYPGAFFNVTYQGKPQQLKLFNAKYIDEPLKLPVGTLKKSDEKLFLSCQNGHLELIELQLSGKKRLKTADFLRGIQIDKLLITP